MSLLPHYDKDCPENIYQADWFKIKSYVIDHLDIHRESGVHYRPAELEKIIRRIVDTAIAHHDSTPRHNVTDRARTLEIGVCCHGDNCRDWEKRSCCTMFLPNETRRPSCFREERRNG